MDSRDNRELEGGGLDVRVQREWSEGGQRTEFYKAFFHYFHGARQCIMMYFH